MSPRLAEVIQQAESLSTKEQLKLIVHLAQQLDQVAESSEFNAAESQTEKTQAKRSLFESFDEFVKGIPAEELAKLPTDGAEQHDHYLYGSPKRPS